MKPTQQACNPFANSDTNKRYYTYDYYLRRTFGGKCLKVALDIGCTCPNIDGTCGYGGCIYCSGRGSGDFAPAPLQTVTAQIEAGKRQLAAKWQSDRVIPYFQAHSNTYGDIDRLRAAYFEAIAYPGTVGVSIATRADCLGGDVLALLAEASAMTHLTVELGLQSASDATAARINRGHDFAAFCAGFAALRRAVPTAEICIHIINGLPVETRDDMLATADAVAALHPNQVKIHSLHVLRGTALAAAYTRGDYAPISLEDYVSVTAEQLTRLPPETVIARVTGDGDRHATLAPAWSLRKKEVIAALDRYLYVHDLWQGKRAEPVNLHIF